jgi:hypothetical protein
MKEASGKGKNKLILQMRLQKGWNVEAKPKKREKERT